MGTIRIKQKKVENQPEQEQQIQQTSEIVLPEQPKKIKKQSKITKENKKSSKFGKSYQRENGNTREDVYTDTINFFDKTSGEYQKIDNTLEEITENGMSFYKNKANSFNVKFAKQMQSDKHIVVEKDGCKLTFSFICEQNSAQQAKVFESENEKDYFGNVIPIKNSLIYENVSPKTDLRFDLHGDRVKDYIILNGRSETYEYTYKMAVENLKIGMNDDSTALQFISTLDNEIKFTIPAPFMSDSNDNISDEVYYDLDEISENVYTMKIVANADWIDNENTVFPVYIDPEIIVENDSALTRYSWYNNTLYAQNGGYKYLGYNYVYSSSSTSSQTSTYYRQYYKLRLNSLKKNAVIQKVLLKVTTNASASNYYLAVGKTSLSLEHTYMIYSPTSDTQITDYGKIDSSSKTCTLDITSIIKDAIANNQTYAKFYLKGLYENTSNPKLTITSSVISTEYIKGCQTQSIGTTDTQDIGRAGTGTVNLYTGALKFTHEDFSWNGNLMPIRIEHLYDSNRDTSYFTYVAEDVLTANFSTMKLGHGFKLNLQQSIISVPEDLGVDATYKYVYCDENGVEHFLKTSENLAEDVFVDEHDESCTYNATEKVLNQNGMKYEFDDSGKLVKITNEYNVSQTITYSNGAISAVQDGAGRTFIFSYVNSYLTSITAPNSKSVTFTYSGDKLIKITHPDGSFAKFEYSNNNLIKVSNGYTENSSEILGLGVEYGYTGTLSVVNKITMGDVVKDINYSSKTLTTVTTTASINDSNDSVTQTVLEENFAFDDDGNYDESYTPTPEEKFTTSENLLLNHSFNQTSNWTIPEGSYVGTTYREYGKTLSILGCGCYNENTAYQTRYLAAGTYTFSAYVRRSRGAYDAVCCGGAYIEITSTNNGTVRSKQVVDTNGEYQRLICTITTTSTQNITVKLVNSGKQYAHFSGVQLQKGETATDYNYLENSSFEKTWTTWTGSGYGYYTNEKADGSYSIKLTGNINYQRYVYQTVYVNTSKTTRETFELSGWAKAYSPLNSTGASANAKFCLRAKINYTDGSYDVFESEFVNNVTDWQHKTLSFAKKEYKIINNVQIYCVFDYNVGEAYFDGLQLIRTQKEENLTASAFAKEPETTEEEQTETDDENITSTEETEQETDQSLDVFGNTLYTINDIEGKSGSMYQSFGYSANGNDKEYETDNRNNKTEYTYYQDTSLVKSEKSPCRSRIDYEYDDMQQLTKMKTDIGNGEIAVNYTYDYLGNIKTITQNGFTYEMDYENGNVKNIGVQGQTPLIQYAYTGGNNVKTATYANGSKMTCKYDRLGNVVSETWVDLLDTVAEYAYTYDSEGNVIATLDKTNKIRYNYTYNNGQVVQSEEYSVQLVNDVVTSATLTHRTELHYKNDKIYQKVETYVNPDGSESSQTYDYSYLDDEEDKFTLILPTQARSVSGLDHFGRKSFDELQLGNGFVTRKYEYVKGAYDSEKFAGKLKSTPETELVEKITFNDGKELRYTYDESGNITTVRNENGALLSAYTYDLLGRLKTEQNVTGQFYTVYNYDNGGNITEEIKYTCQSTEIVADTSALLKINKKAYTYDSIWKDKQVTYINYFFDNAGNQAISSSYLFSYDAGGNPTQYKNMSASWTKGRQLASLGANVYEYNASGVRIEKTVNNVKHTYTVEGIKILREQYSNVTLDFLYGVEDEVVGFTYNGTPYYYRKNLQGDVIGITNSNGTVIVTYEYDAWGKPLTVTGDTVIASINPIRYRSYYYDTETSLYYLNSRYYDPDTCRFINADIIMCVNDDFHANNLFIYCGNEPVSRCDFGGFFWKWLWKKVKKAAKAVAKTLKKATETVVSTVIHTVNNIAVFFGLDTARLGSVFLNMKKINGCYHANFNCWQQYFGYNDFYDFMFDLGTDMDREKFPFYCNGKQYMFWAWKGDYINLGAGAELGIYTGSEPHWTVDKKLAMPMTLKLYLKGTTKTTEIINYSETHWWITGFNPRYLNKKAKNLRAVYTVKFLDSAMYRAFSSKKRKNWTFDSTNKIGTFVFN